MLEADQLGMLAPFAKVITTTDGGREIWGYATVEVPDKSKEIADFDSTVKAFEKWSNDTFERSGGKSRGNVRLMHELTASGKLLRWEPSERVIDGVAHKAIWVSCYIPPTKIEIIRDIDEGILNSFSIGGGYGRKWYDPETMATRYAPIITELSVVDNPCCPGADIIGIVAKACAPWAKRAEGNQLSKAEKLERDKLHEAAESRAKKYGISFKEGKGHLTPPAGKPADESEYGDPTNYAYPRNATHIRAAVSYFNHEGQREDGGYNESEWSKIGHRIAEAASRIHDKKYGIENGKIVTPKEDVEKMNEEGRKYLRSKFKEKFKDKSDEDVEKAMKEHEGKMNKDDMEACNKGTYTLNIGDAGGEVKKDDSGMEAACKAAGITPEQLGTMLKAFVDTKNKETLEKKELLEKAGKKISEDTAVKLRKANAHKVAADDMMKAATSHMDHCAKYMKAAHDGNEYDCGCNIKAADGFEVSKEAAASTSFGKSLVEPMQKMQGGQDELKKTIDNVTAQLGVVVDMKKAIEDMALMVKSIHDAPQQGNIMLGGGSPGLKKLIEGLDSEDPLEKMLSGLSPQARSETTQTIALGALTNMFKGGTK